MVEWASTVNPVNVIVLVWAISFVALGFSIAFDLCQCHKNIKELKGNDE